VNYTSTHGTLTFPAGASAETFTVPVLDDNIVDGPLTFTLALSNPTGAALGAPASATVTVNNTDKAGALTLTAALYKAPPGAPAAAIVVLRTGGATGTLTAAYATAGGNARPGVDYVPVSGVLTFAPGETTKTISVPLLNNTNPGTDVAFALVLSAPGGGATLGPVAAAAVVVRHPLVPISPGGGGGPSPVITDLVPIPGPGGITALLVSFSAPMDPTRASNVGNYNYFVTSPGPDGVYGTYDDTATPIAAAGYNPATHQSVLVFAKPLTFGTIYTAVFNVGAAPGSVRGLTDVAGDLLDGTGTGLSPGSPYVATFGEGTVLAYADHAADGVAVWLTGPGLLALVRGPGGDAVSLRVIGAQAGVTALDGLVRRPPWGGSAPVVIPTIYGASTVQVRLRPPFVVGGVTAFAVDRLSASNALPSVSPLRSLAKRR
jgi:hypothetical protein